MPEVYLSEADEVLLRQKAMHNVLLGLVTSWLSTSNNPQAALRNLKNTVDGICQAGSHSDELETNEYAKRLVASTAALFLDQIKIGQDK